MQLSNNEFNIFVSYNRDELFTFISHKFIVKKILESIERETDNNTCFYFDDLKNDGLTDPEVFKRIAKFLSKDNAALLLISNSPICYGWAEKELLCAIRNNCEIKILNIKKFLKFSKSQKFSIMKLYKCAKLLRVKSYQQ